MRFPTLTCYVVLSSLALGAASVVDAQTVDEVITRARANIGTDSVLDGVRTLRFVGMLETTAQVPSPEDTNTSIDKLVKMPIEIIFQKDYQQRVTLNRPDVIQITALDDYDGWTKSINPKNPKQWSVTLLDAKRIKEIRANNWENLNFFGGLEKNGGIVRLEGHVQVDGVECLKLAFIHASGIVFKRYFAKNTGRLVKTETSSGEIREEGEIIAGGIRFPRRFTNKAPNGSLTVITLDTVFVNEAFPADTFAVPTLQTK